MSYKVAIQAMRHDAKEWRSVADVTGQARAAAAGLSLSAKQLSWAAGWTGLDQTYAQAQARAVRLLAEATSHLRLLGSHLDMVADAYQKSDKKAAQLFGQNWRPRPDR